MIVLEDENERLRTMVNAKEEDLRIARVNYLQNFHLIKTVVNLDRI